MTAVPQGATIIESKPAGADLSANQFYFVELAAGVVTVCNAATDLPYGVLQNKPTSGRQAEILIFGPTWVVADDVIAEGALIGTSADGQADEKDPGTDTSDYVAGRVLEAAAATGDIVKALINCVAPFRAA